MVDEVGVKDLVREREVVLVLALLDKPRDNALIVLKRHGAVNCGGLSRARSSARVGCPVMAQPKELRHLLLRA